MMISFDGLAKEVAEFFEKAKNKFKGTGEEINYTVSLDSVLNSDLTDNRFQFFKNNSIHSLKVI